MNCIVPSYPEGFIIDLLTLPGRDDILEALIHKSVQFFDSKEINVIRSICLEGHPTERVYRGYGFVNTHRDIMVTFRTFNPERQGELEFLKDVPVDKMDFQYTHTDWI